MKFPKTLVLGAGFLLVGCLSQLQTETSAPDKPQVRIAFYNVENLFDTEDDPHRLDEEFLPTSDKKWNRERYEDKIAKLARVVTALNYPELLGLAEVENEAVLRQLIEHPDLEEAGYDLVHYDSPDVRGIDVALLYRTASFTPESSQAIPVTFEEDNYKSRDILQVSGTLGKDAEHNTVHVLVNHWPSRRGGVAQSEPRRRVAARAARGVVDELLEADPAANIVLMGDFNDEPTNRSITDELQASGTVTKKNPLQLYNTLAALDKQGQGSYNFRGDWDMLDQIIISQGLVEDVREADDYHYHPESAAVFKPDWLLQADGNYQGYPDRTYAGDNYLGGYSDHLPVYIELTTEKEAVL